MSRIERVFARRTGADRKINKRQKAHPVFDSISRKVEFKALPHHQPGSPWWTAALADLVDRRVVKRGKAGHSHVTYRPRTAQKGA